MTVRVRHLLYGVLALGIAAVAVFWLGLFNIAASSGHWAVTNWLLHTAMRRSGTFYSADIEPPANLADPALIRRVPAAREGLPADDVAACLGCHDTGNGLGRPNFPAIDGQYFPYLVQQLELFANDPARGGARFASLMSPATHALARPDIDAVATYFATRDPRPRN